MYEGIIQYSICIPRAYRCTRAKLVCASACTRHMMYAIQSLYRFGKCRSGKKPEAEDTRRAFDKNHFQFPQRCGVFSILPPSLQGFLRHLPTYVYISIVDSRGEIYRLHERYKLLLSRTANTDYRAKLQDYFSWSNDSNINQDLLFLVSLDLQDKYLHRVCAISFIKFESVLHESFRVFAPGCLSVVPRFTSVMPFLPFTSKYPHYPVLLTWDGHLFQRLLSARIF